MSTHGHATDIENIVINKPICYLSVRDTISGEDTIALAVFMWHIRSEVAHAYSLE